MVISNNIEKTEGKEVEVATEVPEEVNSMTEVDEARVDTKRKVNIMIITESPDPRNKKDEETTKLMKKQPTISTIMGTDLATRSTNLPSMQRLKFLKYPQRKTARNSHPSRNLKLR